MEFNLLAAVLILLSCMNLMTEAWPALNGSAHPRRAFDSPALYFPNDVHSLLGDLDSSAHSSQIDILQTNTCKCGRKHTERIVGGTKAKSGEWCWQAKVMVWSNDDDGSFFLCGGSIINEEYILTAAHCFYGMEDSKIDVYVGAFKLFRDTEGRRKIVDGIIMHPDYDPTTKANDIALIKLARKITYNDRVCSVCLPTKNEDYTGETATITGWGALKSGGDSPVSLMQAEVQIVSNEKCESQYGLLYPSQMCAAAPGIDSCQGDSGGPLVHKNSEGVWDLIGIVSAGRGCADPHFSGLYTNVYKFLPWIYTNTRGSVYCSRN